MIRNIYSELEFTERFVTNIEDLKGKIIKNIQVSNSKDFIIFELDNKEAILMYHEQDCCESVYIDEIHGDLNNLIGSEILMVEEIEGESPSEVGSYVESYTWTFYKLATVKGYVTIRWFGESNGYYSESVDFAKVKIK